MSIGSSQPFRPAGTASLAAGIASSVVTLAGGGDSLLVTNATSSVAFIRLGSSANVVATATDMPVLPGSRVLLGINPLITTVAVMLATGSGSLFFTRGDGSSI